MIAFHAVCTIDLSVYFSSTGISININSMSLYLLGFILAFLCNVLNLYICPIKVIP